MTILALLVAAFAASALLLRYVMRVPRDYPFRGLLLLAALSALVGFGAAAAWRGAGVARRGAADALAARDRHLAERPADSLGAYVAPYPGARVVEGAAVAAGDARPAGGRWTLATPDAPARVAAHYRAAAAAGGWTVEAQGPGFVVLRRAARALGASGVERLTIRARAARHEGRPATLVSHELSRRY